MSGRRAVERFFDSIACAWRTCRAANADVEAWLKVICALEAQIRQHKEQLGGQLASIQRIHDATDSPNRRSNRSRRARATRTGQGSCSCRPAASPPLDCGPVALAAAA
jgi:hypothetical protein